MYGWTRLREMTDPLPEGELMEQRSWQVIAWSSESGPDRVGRIVAPRSVGSCGGVPVRLLVPSRGGVSAPCDTT